MKKILITGASGLIGQLAVKFFKDKNFTVLTAGRCKNEIYMDFNNPLAISKIRLSEKVDVCLHLAAANEILCKVSPYESVNINITGTKAILDFCVENKIEQIIYISTMHVFGDLVGNLSESTQPIPKNDYGMTHLMAEKYLEMYSARGLIKANIIRPTNLYAVPNDLTLHKRWTLTPYEFSKKAIDDSCIKILTDGNQMRNFLSIDDLNQIILKMIENKTAISLLHAYGPDEISIKGLALLVKSEVQRQTGNLIQIQTNENDRNIYQEFSFKSEYLKDIYIPQKRLTNFISAFLEQYIKYKME